MIILFYRNDEDHYKYDGERNENPDFGGEVNEKGERYGEKGSDDFQDREDAIENYEMEGSGPSISYNQD